MRFTASVVGLCAALHAAAAFSVRSLSLSLNATGTQQLDAPYLSNDSSYFPQAGAEPWDNPNSTVKPRVSVSGDANPFPMAECYGVAIEEATIDQLQAWMTSGKLTSRQITLCYLGRILQLNEYVNAILEVNPDVLLIADQLDAERANGTVRGPLHGIPVVVKDNIASKDKMETTAGSWALLGSVVPRDAHVVKLLREKGAVLLGKSTLDEWASMRTNYKSSGYSARGGQARNAFNLSTAPGGSSSGSCQAVTANMIPIAYGTETDGSVIGPARRASLIGFKPTVGLTSRAGVVPESVHQDTVGAFGRTFKDAIYALEAIVGVDARDNYTLAQQGPADGNYTQFLASQDALKGAVFGLPWLSLWNQTSNSADLPALLKVVERLKAAGATIINGTEFPHYKDVLSPSGWDWAYGAAPLKTALYRVNVDFYNNIRDYLAELNNTNLRGIEDLIAYNIQYTGVEGGIPGTVAGFKSGQDAFLDSAATKGAMNASYYECLDYLNRVSRTEGIDAALSYTYPNGTSVKIDALLVPSGGGATNLPATAGYPMVTMPIGQSNAHDVPVGISLIGSAWSEPALIKYGSAIDDLIQGRQTPTFIEWWSKLVPVDYSL
ncbi:hypothetical protein A1O3_09684 [Capronia epimyces CBS 606.96]|uniref:Amidase domain-containing protein n=1 Tax=Capronia epimyces CBS 606.96 TaxID=1182542 RepID=W9XB75_9EURO|nr:uncharacterized protein A1O3_09684 [Capronia epimyces CBS 606.96]EXJ77458.1 hypothetical protein A1O3_09684 [Capronia epimyces CBS 606.96]